MARRGVDEAGAGIVGDMVAIEQRHVEVVAAERASGWGKHARREMSAGSTSCSARSFDLGLGQGLAASLSARM
jgi:hypothetical protein